jgi:signal transduction histidine kinase
MMRGIPKRVYAEPETVIAMVTDCITEAQKGIQSIYHIRHGLQLEEIQHSFVEPLNNRLDYLSRRHQVPILVQFEGDLDHALSRASREQLYLVLNQAVENALTHAQAKTIQVSVHIQGQGIAFRVSDDGRGASEAERNVAAETGHLGLQTMPSRIRSIGGELKIISAVGEGMTIEGWIPADSNQTV